MFISFDFWPIKILITLLLIRHGTHVFLVSRQFISPFSQFRCIYKFCHILHLLFYYITLAFKFHFYYVHFTPHHSLFLVQFVDFSLLLSTLLKAFCLVLSCFVWRNNFALIHFFILTSRTWYHKSSTFLTSLCLFLFLYIFCWKTMVCSYAWWRCITVLNSVIEWLKLAMNILPVFSITSCCRVAIAIIFETHFSL